MSPVRTMSRLTSIVVIVALAVIAMVGLPCAAVGVPMTGGTPDGHGACALDDHGSLTTVAASADVAQSNTVAFIALLAKVDAETPIVRLAPVAVVSAQLPPPADPRHGRISV